MKKCFLYVLVLLISLPNIAQTDALTVKVGKAEIKMIYVEGGTFTMGNNQGPKDVQPEHKVKLSSFYIGQTEVTQKLWQEVMGTNPCYFKGDSLPVESVTLADCHKFIDKLNSLTGHKFRLPTEAEWEYAARGGNMSNHTQYPGSNILNEVAWTDNVERTQNVALLKPNELGLYDMGGNVCEWTEDFYGEYSANEIVNPKGAKQGLYHPARGGGWNRGGKFCLVYDRGNYRPEYASNAVGLRLVMDK